MPKSVAIIGAGWTGLTAIKCCLDEGLQPFCFESASQIGGLWHFSDDITDGRGSVMATTVINTSKEMMAFSDFPPPKDFPNFMPHSKVLDYFHLYAKEFDLLRHIAFDTEVISVSKSANFCDNNNTIKGNNRCTTNPDSHCETTDDSNCVKCENGVTDRGPLKSQSFHKSLSENTGNSRRSSGAGGWAISVRNKSSGMVTTQVFDFVLVCTGHHAQINMPFLPGQGIYKGRILHSRDVRRPSEMKGSRHVVVGVGNSGCDVAVELSRHGKVFLSTRRGAWLMARLQKRGLPADIAYTNRLVFATAFGLLPRLLLDLLVRRDLESRLDHELYGLRADHDPLATHPTVNDELPNRIASGHVTVTSDITSLTETGVRFSDGSVEDNIDTVVLATGYKIGFPFIDQSELDIKDNQTSLYLHMFPPTNAPPTLAVIGCVQPGGALGPVSEMQCRLATRVFKGDVQLPSKSDMLEDISRRERAMSERYIGTLRHTVQVDFIPYMDTLAQLVGCKPALGRMLVSSPKLWYQCVFGPCTPYQYRLDGPGAWSGSREAIFTQMERVRYPFSKRVTTASKDKVLNLWWIGFIVMLMLSFVFALSVAVGNL